MQTTISETDMIRTETRGGELSELVYHVCKDCRAWCHDGEALKHGKRCDTPDAQPVICEEALTTPSARRVANQAFSARELKRRGADGTGLSSDEAFDAALRGQITIGDAMNRDD